MDFKEQLIKDGMKGSKFYRLQGNEQMLLLSPAGKKPETENDKVWMAQQFLMELERWKRADDPMGVAWMEELRQLPAYPWDEVMWWWEPLALSGEAEELSGPELEEVESYGIDLICLRREQ